uniref:Uncharacterized protein n=1 Tax=Rhizophora mucronata TaxID=61149 RepID=A0A2P2NAK7_RHIMU
MPTNTACTPRSTIGKGRFCASLFLPLSLVRISSLLQPQASYTEQILLHMCEE